MKLLVKTFRGVVGVRQLAVAALVLLATAGTALAVTLSGDGTLVGCSAPGTTTSCTTANDTLAAGNANDIVWGLAGSDTISAGNGNDMIDGDGMCQQGDEGQRFPNGVPGTNQCEHGHHDQNGQRDTISAGNGNDTVFGGGGHNTISVGAGTDTIYGGPLGDTISTGSNGHPTVWLCGNASAAGPCLSSYSGSNVSTGTMAGGTIYAQNGTKDTISCNNSKSMKVYADKGIDVLNKCPTVVYSPEPARDVAGRLTTRRHAAHKARHLRKRHHKATTKRSYTF